MVLLGLSAAVDVSLVFVKDEERRVITWFPVLLLALIRPLPSSFFNAVLMMPLDYGCGRGSLLLPRIVAFWRQTASLWLHH